MVFYNRDMGKENYTDILLEEVNSKFDFIVEAVHATNERLERMPDKNDLKQISNRLEIVEYSIKELSKKVSSHDKQFKLLSNVFSRKPQTG